MLSNVTENVISDLLVAALFTLVAFLLIMLPGQLRKRRKFRFFGIDPGNPTLTIYLSVVNVITPFTTGTFRLQPDSNEILMGAFTGSAIPEGELSLSTHVFKALQPDPLDGFPDFARKWLTKRNKWFKPLQLTLASSPSRALPYPGFEFKPLISIGSQTYNSVSAYYAERHPGYLRLISSPWLGVEVTRGTKKGKFFSPQDSSRPGGLALLEKIIDDEHGNVAFVASGAGIGGSMGATLYLIFGWERLARKYGDKPFAIMLEVDLTQTTSELGIDGVKFHQFETFPE
jgi:hypothetical protein